MKVVGGFKGEPETAKKTEEAPVTEALPQDAAPVASTPAEPAS